MLCNARWDSKLFLYNKRAPFVNEKQTRGLDTTDIRTKFNVDLLPVFLFNEKRL